MGEPWVARLLDLRSPASPARAPPAHLSHSSGDGPVLPAESAINHALQGRYTIERELGRGGMATVYLARDLRHDRPVALKLLHPELAASLGPERFLREIRTTAQLQSPH